MKIAIVYHSETGNTELLTWCAAAQIACGEGETHGHEVDARATYDALATDGDERDFAAWCIGCIDLVADACHEMATANAELDR